MKKRIVSILTVLCILISAVPALAFYPTGSAIPKVGVLTFHDFENNTAGLAASQLQAYSGGAYNITTNPDADMHNANVVVVASGNNKHIVHAQSGASFLYGIRDRVDTAAADYAEHFESGLLKLEYDVLVPTTTNTADDSNYVYYYTNNKETNGYAYLNQVSSVAGSASIYFPTVLSYAARPTDKMVEEGTAVKINIENNKWYKITMFIDYDRRAVTQFLDGELVASYTASESAMLKYHSFSLAGLYKGGSESNTGTYMHIDNFLIERMDNSSMKADVYAAEVYADIKFDSFVDEEEVCVAANYTLKKFDGSKINISNVEKIDGNTIRIYFEESLDLGSYEISLNKDISALGSAKKLPKGTKLVFNNSKITHIDQDFENVTFPTAHADSVAFNDFYYYGKKEANSEKEFEAANRHTYYYAKKVEDTQDSTNNMLRFYHNDAWPTAADKGLEGQENNTHHKSLMIPFANGATASSGKLTVEFDVKVKANDYSKFQDFGFGLHDTTRTADAYDWNSQWSDATLFMGLTRWGHNTRMLVAAGSKDGRAKIYGRYKPTGVSTDDYLPDSNDQMWNGSDPRALAVTNIDDDLTSHMKFVVDLDNNTFTFAFTKQTLKDGVIKVENFEKTCDYIPGGATNGVYDGFVLTSVDDGRSPKTISATNATVLPQTIFLDNVKVVQDMSSTSLAVENIEFQSGAQKFAYADTVDYKTNRMKITMSKEISDSIVNDYVSFSGDDMYFIYAEGKDIFVEFEEGLTYNKDYTVTLSKDLVSEDGVALGTDVVLSFKTIGDDITYGNPIITYDADILEVPSAIEKDGKIEVTVNTKSGVSCGALIMVAAYKGGKLSGVAADNVTSSSGKLVLSHIADDTFVGADVIKAFVLDGTVFKPITTATVVE